MSDQPQKSQSHGIADAEWAERSAARERCPADLTMHCSYDYSMYILAVRGTQVTASRGYPQWIKSLEVPAEKVDAFKDWCVERGIENPEPKWLLCSMWG